MSAPGGENQTERLISGFPDSAAINQYKYVSTPLSKVGMKNKFKAAEGFTLLELLVVFAIIAILAALLLSAISATKNRGQRTTCLNNLRQINLGVRMYSDDSHDASPSPGSPGATLPNFESLFSGYKELMKNYVGLKGTSSPQDKVFTCPADVMNANWFVGEPPLLPVRFVNKSVHDSSRFDYSSYAFNGGDNVTRSFGEHTFTLPGLTGVKLSSVRHPGRTILLAEVPALLPYSWHDPLSHGLATDFSSTVYNDSKNMVSFVDGHVRYIKMHSETNFPALFTNPPAGYDYQWSPD
jgi:prepilin-type N-terminal cleavage/methylation domain-containing protein/prepilin-type processing-associated H-X9-DG protein